MEKVLRYKNFETIIHFSPEDNIFYGKIENIEDFVNFHSNTFEGIEKEFRLAVDDYLEICKYYGKDWGYASKKLWLVWRNCWYKLFLFSVKFSVRFSVKLDSSS